MDLPQIAAVVRDLGITGLLVAILYGGAKRWWVFGWLYEAKTREADEWKTLALRGTHIAELLADGNPSPGGAPR